MKRNLIALSLYALASISIVAIAQESSTQQRLVNVQFIKTTSDLYKKRENAIPEDIYSKFGAEVIANMAKVTDEKEIKEIKERGNGWVIAVAIDPKRFMCASNKFWKEDVFQEAAASEFVKRVSLITWEGRKEWDDAFSKKLESPRETFLLGLIALQDRLFNSSGFIVEESRKSIKRFMSIPPDNFAKMMEIGQLGNKHLAAFSLITFDLLFKDDVFQQNEFDKIVKSAAQK